MHRSQIGGVIIDCKVDDLDAAADFWSAALGMKRTDTATSPNYIQLEREPNGLDIVVQKVAHDSRVHLDIETDDIEAEVVRLEKLGATRVRKVDTWWVLEAPTGQRFCVVRAGRAHFARDANTWE